jgi:CRP/FNR family transcriptional regulator, cyclic AMP receptor protein
VTRPTTGLAVSGLDDDPFAGASVLGALDAEDRRALAERSRRRWLVKGQILFSEGDHADSVVVLISGHMKVLTYSPGGDEFIVNTVLPGDTVGEIGVLSNGPRSATVQATEPSEVLSLPGSALLELIASRPALATALITRLSAIARRVTDLAADLVFLDLRQRVAKYLRVQEAVDGGRTTRPRLTQSDLAASVGASRQRVNACLQEFQAQGWIAIERRGVRIIDADALDRVVDV